MKFQIEIKVNEQRRQVFGLCGGIRVLVADIELREVWSNV